MKLDGEDKYIGYDDIGDDFEPAVTYWDANNTGSLRRMVSTQSLSTYQM
ncbi:MAG: hypothetical protein ACYCYI_14075 [Saccharofermentanales bacterium]